MNIALPYQFAPRPYQARAMGYFDAPRPADARTGHRGVYVWGRRTGKDTTMMHQAAKMAHERIGVYYHMLPSFAQAKRVIWDYIDDQGRRLIDQVFPHPLRAAPPNESELKIKLSCGSMWQLIGADNYDATMGSNPVGIVFSEYALTDPRAWHFFRPILHQNKGWAAFISTPRGYNHMHQMLRTAMSEPGWDHSLVDALQAGTMTRDDIEREIREGMPEELARQEYLCDFSAANVGAILGRYLEAAEREGRIRDEVEYDPDGAGVVVSSDIGFDDAAAWWWWQPKPDGFALLRYEEDTGLDATDWIERLPDAGLPISKIYLPHDAKAKTFQTRHSALEQFMRAANGGAFGKHCVVDIVPQSRKVDRINAARTVMSRCHFNALECVKGLEMLRSWQFKYNEETRVFSKEPEHNYASHGGDAFSYGAQMLREVVRTVPSEPKPFAVPLHNTLTLNMCHRWRASSRHIRS